MWSNDIFQQRLSAQAKENTENTEHPGKNTKERNPSLLKRVGKSLVRIVEAPLHVVGGVLEAGNHALHGRLDRSAKSIAGWFKAWFGSLHEGIREMPLVGDVIQKVEKAAFGIKENMRFSDDEKTKIIDAEEKFKQSVNRLLWDKYGEMNNEDLLREAENIQKKVLEGLQKEEKEKKSDKNSPKTMLESDYAKFEQSWFQKFSDLTARQKAVLYMEYSKKGTKPDLKDPIIQEYYKNLIQATGAESKPEDKQKLQQYVIDNLSHLRGWIPSSDFDSSVTDYYINLAERTRRSQNTDYYGTASWFQEQDHVINSKMDARINTIVEQYFN